MKPLVDQAFWSDQEIERASSTVKLAALWLITNSQTNLIGVCGASEARFVFETGLKPEALQRALEALPKSFVKVGDVIFVRNYIRHQFGAGEKLVRNNFFTSLSSLFLAVKNPELKVLILEQYPEFLESSERAYQGLTKPKDGKDREGKAKERGVKRGRPLDDPTFNEFWAAYPRKKSKGDAETAWVKNGCSEILPKILTTIRTLKASPEWTRDPDFIPYPASWLNAKGWEDEVHTQSNGHALPNNRPKLPPPPSAPHDR